MLIMALVVINTYAQKDRPNIVWFTCEDISPTLSMYGDSTAKTPNLDQLAKEGIVFDNVFAVVGVCAPSRSSIITGMYPTSIGTMHMRTAKDIQSWGLRKYDGESMAVDINGEKVPHYSTVIPSYVKCFPEYMRKTGYYCINNQKTDYQFAAPVTAWDENNGKGDWAHTPNGKPFFYVFNHGVTHESQIWKRKNKPMTVDPKIVPLPSYYPDDSIVRQDVARNYSNIEVLDKQIGEKIQRLKDAGLYENTIIFFFSDHGGPLPRGKRLHYDSGLKVPFIVRIPEKYKEKYGIDPSWIKNGHVDKLISFVDLAPTLLSIAGYEIPEYMQGKAFMGPQRVKEPRKYIFGSGDRFDEHTDRNRIVRDNRYLYVRNYHPELPAYKDIAYRKNIDMMNRLLELHKLGRLNPAQNYWFRMYKTKEEFYDCITDPDNVHNLIDDPKYQDKIEELRQVMDNWLSETGDMAEVPEKEMYLQMWPDGIQPITERPVIHKKGRTVTFSCGTEGASIAYLISGKDFTPGLNAGWQVYYQPVKIPKGKYLYVMSQRIGYKESEIVKEKF
ncbi:MAG: sulfatase-like hydrolase/transferase [Chlorobi bacterium]|nr:sulfatase-like hydrolase/transferase [Chlorobiota bacterium]